MSTIAGLRSMNGFVLSLILVACGAPLAGPTPEDGSQRTPPPAAVQTAAAGERSDPPSERPSSQPPPTESAGDAGGSFAVEIRDEDSPIPGHVLIEVVGLRPNESVELTFSFPGQEDGLSTWQADETGTIAYAHPREMGGVAVVARRASGEVVTGAFGDIAPTTGIAPATEEATPSTDAVEILSISPEVGALTTGPVEFELRVGYRLVTRPEGDIFFLLLGPDGQKLKTDPDRAGETWPVLAGEGVLEIRTVRTIPEVSSLRVGVTLDAPDDHGILIIAETRTEEYHVGPPGGAKTSPTPRPTSAAAAPAPPAGPHVQARPSAASPGDHVDFVFTGFPIPVSVLHLERVTPDGLTLPLRQPHDWYGPYETWWIEDFSYLGPGPWPSGTYIERFEVDGVVYDVPVVVSSSAGQAALARQLSASVERREGFDLVTFVFSGFPLLTEILHKETVLPDGDVFPEGYIYGPTATFEHVIRLPISTDDPRGTYVFRFVAEGSDRETAVVLSP